MAKALEQETDLNKARRELNQRQQAQNQYNKMIQDQEDEQLGLQDRSAEQPPQDVSAFRSVQGTLGRFEEI